MILHNAYGIRDYGRFEAVTNLYDEIAYRVADSYPDDIDDAAYFEDWLD